MQTRTKLEADLDTLCGLLKTYGDHLPSCTGRDGGYGPKGRPCSCGWGFEDDEEGSVMELLDEICPKINRE